ncbi:hypothetical protein B1748_19075 [Paenibacillus sp. MY03]|jgi:hypothetical protein|uniref:acyltransferase domain-containing protein n=1 Tax=Paenibacillus sp. MY03 TaxID=302980 RepID=UPI000B3C2780|nr:acyltransferase domain-containing protein [Paenibacillus sp. MY03]OUS75008.1 hypothetical protein B1748_19075 [Paenibacillus sp. MY03]
MNIERLCNGIQLPSHVVRQVLEYEMDATLYENAKRHFGSDYMSFFEEEENRPGFRARFLYLFIRFAVDLYEEYKRREIDDTIYYDTFSDLRIWCMECKRQYGEYGLQEYRWFKEHLRLRLFRLGRLQFHPYAMKSDVVVEGKKIYENQIVLNVHIPAGEPLAADKVEASFELARRFFRGMEPVFVCHSWILEPRLQDILKSDSNLLQFQRQFSIYKHNPDSRQAEERIFQETLSDYSAYPESTELQRSAKRYLLAGHRLGAASGIKL